MTPQAFRKKVRDAIADNATSGVQEFSDSVLDGWRDDEVGLLYARGLFFRATTRTLAGWTEPTIATTAANDGTLYVPRYYALPASFKKVLGVEFVDTQTDEPVWNSTDWTDNEEPGYIRIDDIDRGVGYKLRYFGEREFTAVDDTAITAPVLEVLKYGVVVQAFVSELSKRTKAARSQVATRTTDASPGAISAALYTVERVFKGRLADALRVQPYSRLGA